MREDAGAFDVSHMGEIEVEGPRARDLLQSLLSNGLERIEPGGASTRSDERERGIVDDLIVYELDPFRYLLIVNASIATPTRLAEREVQDVRDVSDEYGLIALRGPIASAAEPRSFAEGEIGGITCMVNRTGYTGEEGVELLRWRRKPAALDGDRARRHAL